MLEHLAPGISKDGKARDGVMNALRGFAEVARGELAVHIIIKPPQGNCQIAAPAEVDRIVQLVKDLLSTNDVVIDGEVEFERVFVLEAGKGEVEEPDGAIVKHENQLAGRGGLCGDSLVRSERSSGGHSCSAANRSEALNRRRSGDPA